MFIAPDRLRCPHAAAAATVRRVLPLRSFPHLSSILNGRLFFPAILLSFSFPFFSFRCDFARSLSSLLNYIVVRPATRSFQILIKLIKFQEHGACIVCCVVAFNRKRTRYPLGERQENECGLERNRVRSPRRRNRLVCM